MAERTPLRWTATIAAAAALAAALLGAAGALRLADATLYDQAATRLPAPATPHEVVIVAIDEPSFADLNLPWPWPRSLHARLIDQLRAAGARRIAFDVIFADPGDPAEDAALAAALGPDVVLGCDAAWIETPQGLLLMAVEPPPDFLSGGARCGQVAIPLDPDGGLRALPPGADGLAASAAAAPAPPPGARIDVSRPPGTLLRVSYYQALDAAASLPSDLFRDRIVVVGFDLRAPPDAREGGPERFRTPWTARDHGLASGAEMQARAAETLALGRWTLPAPAWAPPALAVLAATAAALLARFSAAPAGVAVAFAAAAAVAALCLAALLGGLWLPPAVPALAAFAAGLGQTGLDHARERAVRRRIHRAFERYLAPEMVRRLAADPRALRLGGERRTISILFCDLRGFTTLTERMKDDPEALTAILNRALTVVADAILESGGMVDKFIGDCAMGVWNAPLETPGHAVRAIKAGLRAVESVARLSTELDAEALSAGRAPVGLACGVGIESGDCVVGNMGSDRRFDYTALGDAVNLAARLEGLTKRYGSTLLVGEAAAALAPDLPLIELDLIAVKGRSAATRIFLPAALWPAPQAAPLQSAALAAFRARRWPDAIAAWRRLAAAEPAAAGYAEAMIGAAEAHAGAPPPPDWAGATVADRK